MINDFSGAEKEYLKLYKSWCLFAYQEFYIILLAILDKLSLRIHGEKTKIPNKFMQRL
jgi:hypothetical protein